MSASGKVNIQIDHPISKVWDTVKSFGDLSWAGSECTVESEPSDQPMINGVRTVKTGTGVDFQDTLVEYSLINHFYTIQSQSPYPRTVAMRLIKFGERTLVEFSISNVTNEQSRQNEDMYRRWLASLKQLLTPAARRVSDVGTLTTSSAGPSPAASPAGSGISTISKAISAFQAMQQASASSSLPSKSTSPSRTMSNLPPTSTTPTKTSNRLSMQIQTPLSSSTAAKSSNRLSAHISPSAVQGNRLSAQIAPNVVATSEQAPPTPGSATPLQKVDSTNQFETPSQIFVMVSEAEEATSTLNQFQRLRAKSTIAIGSTGAVETTKLSWMSPAVKRYKTVHVDFSSATSIAKSLAGTKRLLIALPRSADRTELGKSVIKAAKQAGISFILLISVPLPKFSEQSATPEQQEFASIESTLADEFDRKAFCILRVHISHEFFAIFRNSFRLPIKESTAIPTISLFDVGLCASRILLNPEDHLGVDYTLTGPKLYATQMADDLSLALSKQIAFEHMVEEGAEWAKMMTKEYGMTKYDAENYRAELEDYYVRYQFTVEESDDFVKITGHKQRSFLQTLQHVLRSDFKGPSKSLSCGCGAVKLQTVSLPLAVFVSHCIFDRRTNATERVDYCLFDLSQITVVQGLAEIEKMNFGDQRRRWTCRKCYTRVALESSHEFPLDSMAVPLSAFDDWENLPQEFAPQFHTHYLERVRCVVDGLPKYYNLPRQFGGDGNTMPEKTPVPRAPETFTTRLTKNVSYINIAEETTPPENNESHNVHDHIHKSEHDHGDGRSTTNATVDPHPVHHHRHAGKTADEQVTASPTRKKAKSTTTTTTTATTDYDGELSTKKSMKSLKAAEPAPSNAEAATDATTLVKSPSARLVSKKKTTDSAAEDSGQETLTAEKKKRTKSKINVETTTVEPEVEVKTKKRTKSPETTEVVTSTEEAPQPEVDAAEMKKAKRKSIKKSSSEVEPTSPEIAEEVVATEETEEATEMKKAKKKSINTSTSSLADFETKVKTLKKKKSKVEV